MSKQLFDAIYDYYTALPANAFYTATGGRLDYCTAQDDWTDNFAVIQGNGASPVGIFRDDFDDVYFQINVFAIDRTDCWDLLTRCRALFDGATLTVADHYPVALHRETVTPPMFNDVDDLYQATIEFRCALQRA